MSFLDDLLEFKEPLDKGTKLYLPGWKEKSFFRKGREFFTGKKEPDEYRSHLTKGNLRLILPHNRNKTVYQASHKNVLDKDLFFRSKKWNGKIDLGHGFNLEETIEKMNEDNKIILGSKIKKTVYSEELNLGVNIYVSYSVSLPLLPSESERIEIYHLSLKSEFTNLKKGDIREISVEVFRDQNSKFGMGKGPEIITNIDIYPEIPEESIVDYDQTLGNMVTILNKNISSEQMIVLFNADYLETVLLH
ncbi:MAG: hypothetical protein KKA62_04765 [Nanoarchaeota archaeon]|nr:hypothetical protein [Nanoarchaeota archaeon]MBU1644247.1 hypothetical protein [Nanoarchaeota archaeon]MBU1977233.1 hypothetical protein [Nanoarchaeota archaeon]